MIGPRSPTLRQPRLPPGFTMIEMMIVLAIMGVLLTTGIPLIYHNLRRSPMSQAIHDVTEACIQARAAAILTGETAELIIRPPSGSLSVSVAAPPSSGDDAGSGAARPLPKSFSAQLSDEVVIEMLDVNLREFKDEEEARVRFFPNGTTDEFTLFLQWGGVEWRKLSLEILTGLINLEVVR